MLNMSKTIKRILFNASKPKYTDCFHFTFYEEMIDLFCLFTKETFGGDIDVENLYISKLINLLDIFD